MKVFIALFLNSLLCIWRDRRFLAASAVFSLMLVAAASVLFRRIGYSERELLEITPGVIWIIFLFVGVIALNQLFSEELVDNAISGLVLQVGDLGLLFAAKTAANILFLCAIEFLVIFAHGLFFGVSIFQVLPSLFLLVFVSSIGFASLGTLLSAISVCTRSREIVLPLLLYPMLLIPVAAAASVTNDILAQGAFPGLTLPFIVVCVFSAVSCIMSWLLFEFVVRG